MSFVVKTPDRPKAVLTTLVTCGGGHTNIHGSTNVTKPKWGSTFQTPKEEVEVLILPFSHL